MPYYLGFGALLFLGATLLVLPFGKALRQYRFIAALSVSVFVLSSIVLYGCWGGYRSLQDLAAFQEIDNFFAPFSQQGEKPDKDEVIANLAMLENKIAYSAAALARLGYFYNELGLYEKALNCFDKARMKAPDNIDYQAQWIYSYSLMNQGKLDDEMRSMAQRLIKQQPQQFVLTNLLAIDAYLQKDFTTAITHWQFLVDNDKTLTDERQAVLANALYKAKLAAGVDKDADVSIKVKVAVSEKIRSQMSANDVVFVYVKSPAMKMPLAVLKREARDLPFTVELTNQHQMMPGVGLKVGDQVTVVAKVSKNGDPLAKEGTLQAEKPELMINYGTNDVSILIDSTRGNS